MSTYELMRHFADSWGLLAMMLLFLGLVGWTFRPGARRHLDAAAAMIFKPETTGPAPDRSDSDD
jgi:cytochrome c oxidase cbb3-type subunit 4